jgi:acetyltransferase-like isoleucine patch superfamily enzyme
VFVGVNSVILAGVTVGRYAIIGAGSVVTSNIRPYSVAMGNPARVVRQIRDDERNGD